jgi:hypothetical protein
MARAATACPMLPLALPKPTGTHVALVAPLRACNGKMLDCTAGQPSRYLTAALSSDTMQSRQVFDALRLSGVVGAYHRMVHGAGGPSAAELMAAPGADLSRNVVNSVAWLTGELESMVKEHKLPPGFTEGDRDLLQTHHQHMQFFTGASEPRAAGFLLLHCVCFYCLINLYNL